MPLLSRIGHVTINFYCYTKMQVQQKKLNQRISWNVDHFFNDVKNVLHENEDISELNNMRLKNPNKIIIRHIIYTNLKSLIKIH